MKCKLLLLILTFYSIVSSADIGLSNKGIEFGFGGQKNYKIDIAMQLNYLGIGKYKFYDPRLIIYNRWLKVENNIIRLNLLSGLFWGLDLYEDKYYSANNYKSALFGLDLFSMEPEININQNLSIFLRTNILRVMYSGYNGFGCSIFTIYLNGSEFDKINFPLWIGMRYNFRK